MKLTYDIVGSFLRPEAIKNARKDFKEGKITREELTKVEDKEIAAFCFPFVVPLLCSIIGEMYNTYKCQFDITLSYRNYITDILPTDLWNFPSLTSLLQILQPYGYHRISPRNQILHSCLVPPFFHFQE